MGFVGRLEDLSLTDILHILSMGRRSGKLTLTRRKQQGMIVFLHGGIVYCQSNTVHETLGSILVNRHIISESSLLGALERQQAGANEPLGSILVGMGTITEDVLQDTIREQIKTVLSELMSWTRGTFQFEPLDFPQGTAAALDASEYLVEEGLRPEEMVLELLTRLDEMKQEEASASSGSETDATDALQIDTALQSTRSGAARGASRGFASLKTIMGELRRQPFSFTGEISLMLLRYTAELVNRSILLAVRDDGFVGIGQFGIEIEGVSPDDRVRTIKIPTDEPSVFNDVLTSNEPFRGRLAKTSWNTYLIQQLGGRVPREAFVVPIVVNGASVAVIYGDNLPDDTLIGPMEGLELLMIEAGLIIEKHRLQEKLRAIERSR